MSRKILSIVVLMVICFTLFLWHKGMTNANIITTEDANKFVNLCAHSSPEEIQSALNNGADVFAEGLVSFEIYPSRETEARMNPLMAASLLNSDPEVIKILLNAGANVNAINNNEVKYLPSGMTALMYAAMKNSNPEVLRVLIEAGAQVERSAKNREDVNAVYFAVSANPNLEVLNILLNAGANVSDDILINALNNSNPEILSALIHQGLNVNVRNKYGTTPLIEAAGSNSNLEVLKILLNAGADINAQNKYGVTPLINAARNNNNPEIVIALIEAGADVHIRDYYGSGRKAIDHIMNNNNLKNTNAVKVLQNTMTKSQDTSQPYNYLTSEEFRNICGSGSVEDVKNLLSSKNVSWDSMIISSFSDSYYYVPVLNEAISAAMVYDKIEIINYIRSILSADVDINAKNSETGEQILAGALNVVLGFSSFFDNLYLVIDLIVAGADLTSEAGYRDMPLMEIAEKIPELIPMLINSGIDVNIQDKNGQTMLMKVAAGFNIRNWRADLLEKIAHISSGDVNIPDKMNDSYTIALYSLIKAGADVNTADKNGMTALMKVYDGNLDRIKILLDSGADVNIRAKDGTTALLEIAAHSLTMLNLHSGLSERNPIQTLINSGADVNVKNGEGDNILTLILKRPNINYYSSLFANEELSRYFPNDSGLELELKNSVPFVRSLVSAGIDINSVNNNGETALTLAIQKNLLLTAIELVKSGAKLSEEKKFNFDKDKAAIIIRSLLHSNSSLLTKEAKISLIKSAVRYGFFDINAKDKNGWTLLMDFSQENPLSQNHSEIVNMLIEAGADVNISTNDGITALMIAAHHNQTEIIKELAAHGVNLEAKDSNEDNALTIAIKAGQIDSVKTLIQAGANVNTRNKKGVTALMMASVSEKAVKNPEILKALINAGANINARDDELGATALIIASAIGTNPEIISELLNAGANPNLTSNEGGRAIDYIRNNEKLNQTSAVNLLVMATESVQNFRDNDITKNRDSGKIDVFKLARIGIPEQLREAVSRGAKFNVERNYSDISDDDIWLFENSETPLHHAAFYNHNPESIRFLISQGLDVNASASSGMGTIGNPLSCAIKGKNVEGVKELLKAGADPNSWSQEGTYTLAGSPFHLLAILYTDNNDHKLAEIIIQALRDVGGKVDNHTESPERLNVFLPRSKWTSSNPLENMDASNAEMSNFVASCTPLMYAVMYDNPGIVNLLLDAGADPNIRSAEGKTAMDYANNLPKNARLRKWQVFNRLKTLSNSSGAKGSNSNWDRADMLVGQGKIPMYVRDKGRFIYNSKMKMVLITANNVRLRSQPNANAKVITRDDKVFWGSIDYLGEWTHPNGDKWIVGLYDDWRYAPERATPENEKKVIWVSAKYAKPVTWKEYERWRDNTYVPE